MENLKVEVLPGGAKVASGGTRTQIKLSRPWQVNLAIDTATCPFDTQPQNQILWIERSGGWRVLQNLFTPHDWHRLIVPAKCWTDDEVRTLGGFPQIQAALGIASSLICEAQDDEFWLGVHIGALAGQNIAHLHYHLFKPVGEPPIGAPLIEEYFSASPLSLFDEPNLKVVLGGHRAGQCFILPNGSLTIDAPSFAVMLDRIIGRYASAFRSTQGLPPDYLIGVKLLGCRIHYATYVPVLNNWGITEYMGLLEQRPLILPWPHEESLRWLLTH
jgi:diadenosine tetraphosphate (Ap4A) HIT family hydrolase